MGWRIAALCALLCASAACTRTSGRLLEDAGAHVFLSEGNYRVVKAHVVGESSGYYLLTFIPLGTPAQAIGHITFSLIFVVIIVRGRLLAIGPEYEEAARDLGASRMQAIRLALLPMLVPAIVAITLFVAVRIAFSAVNDALGARPDRELGDAVPQPVREAVTFGPAAPRVSLVFGDAGP